ncbi:DUF397 domain-containing protein [Streptomyces sp. NPDC006997]|uniref:DUF397 domain-containing protein n=1 Tax=Streptomyces sp. NPDC006997 TaxID=3155356 RepID=UPI0033DA3B52
MIRKASTDNATDLAWFKSSYSSGSEGESCVEVAAAPRTVHIRDSKNIEGPRLAVTPTAWAGFITYAAEG